MRWSGCAPRATRSRPSRPRRRRYAARCNLLSCRYRTGVASYLEVLDAQRSLFDAELGLSQAQLRQLAAAVQLYRALGGGSWLAGTGPGGD